MRGHNINSNGEKSKNIFGLSVSRKCDSVGCENGVN